MELNESLSHGETKTDPRDSARDGIFPAAKGIKDPLPVLRANPDPGIADGDRNGARVPDTGRNGDLAFGGRELDRIRDQVQEDLTELMDVTPDRGELRLPIERKLNRLVRRLGSNQGIDLLEDDERTELFGVEKLQVGNDLSEVQEVMGQV